MCAYVVVGNGQSQNKLPVLMNFVVALLHGLTYLYAALLYTTAGFMQTHGFPLLKGQLSLSVTSASTFPVKSTCCGKVKGGGEGCTKFLIRGRHYDPLTCCAPGATV